MSRRVLIIEDNHAIAELAVLDGLEVCSRLRERRACIPVLELTAKSSELDRVVGLEMLRNSNNMRSSPGPDGS